MGEGEDAWVVVVRRGSGSLLEALRAASGLALPFSTDGVAVMRAVRTRPVPRPRRLRREMGA